MIYRLNLQPNFLLYLFSRATLVVCVFVFSLFFLSYYVEGDQVHYRLVYSGLFERGLVEGYFFYNVNLSSYEFIHFILSWLFSRVLEKDYFIALSNSLLALLIIKYFDKQRVFFVVTVLFVMSNFYLLVLFFSAERLKFGFIFFLLSICFYRRIKLFGILSVASHVQFLIIYAGIVFSFVFRRVTRLFRTGKFSLNILYLFLLGFLILLVMWPQIQIKFISYFSVSTVNEYWRLFIFFVLALWYSKKKQETLLIFIPLFMGVALFGGDRINMFGYFVFLYYALQVNRGLNLGLLITSMYFSYSSYGFLSNIVNHGDGFYVG